MLTSPTAIAFSYFETLLRIGDKARILEELTRLKSLNNLLNQAGFAEHLYEDFVAETLDLLSEIAYSLPSSGDDAGLLKAFNDAGISSAIITHFRVRIKPPKMGMDAIQKSPIFTKSLIWLKIIVPSYILIPVRSCLRARG